MTERDEKGVGEPVAYGLAVNQRLVCLRAAAI
jgi:hypothetical protein